MPRPFNTPDALIFDARLRRPDDQVRPGQSSDDRREPPQTSEGSVRLTLPYSNALEAGKKRTDSRPRVNADPWLAIVGDAIEPPRHDVGHRSCRQLAVLH